MRGFRHLVAVFGRSRWALPALSTTLFSPLLSCGGAEPAQPPPGTPKAAAASHSVAPPAAASVPPKVDRDGFNRAALAIGAPIFWQRDRDGNGEPGNDELTAVMFQEEEPPSASQFVNLVARVKDGARSGSGGAQKSPATGRRESLIAREIGQLRPVVVRSDLRDLSPAEKTMVRHVLDATRAVDRIHAHQRGLLPLADRVTRADAQSRALFRRNWGPRCVAPETENDTECTALEGVDRVAVDVYPTKMQSDPKFCTTLEKHPDAKKLFDPFTVVRERAGKLVALPYAEATTELDGGKIVSYVDDMRAATTALEAAAKALDGTKETALQTYLRAAAKAFRDGSWFEADEAWSKMSGKNSRFYLRIGPDETYWEPCARKAGFHVSFARVSAASLAWQERLDPVKQLLEGAIADAIGQAAYRPRKITFHLPEFIDVMWNGGDSRDAIGATIGQSLPNWGPVPAKGRGRTVAMANLYTDEDSLASRERAAKSLLCEDVMAHYPKGPESGLVATILHEATHNLGPSQEYRFQGKTDVQWFGGGLASTMEELKAQTGALFFIDLLRQKNVIDEALARSSALDSVVWAFGHISRGMTTPTGERKPYGQLAAIQVGYLLDAGALTFAPEKAAANGKDRGCFSIDWSKFTPSAAKMMSDVGKIKATGDRKGAEALAGKYVDAKTHHALIRERMLREPRPSFLYAIDLD